MSFKKVLLSTVFGLSLFAPQSDVYAMDQDGTDHQKQHAPAGVCATESDKDQQHPPAAHPFRISQMGMGGSINLEQSVGLVDADGKPWPVLVSMAIHALSAGHIRSILPISLESLDPSLSKIRIREEPYPQSFQLKTQFGVTDIGIDVSGQKISCLS